jgi:hypothetical protein
MVKVYIGLLWIAAMILFVVSLYIVKPTDNRVSRTLYKVLVLLSLAVVGIRVYEYVFIL